jgi:hypothetical protein
MAKQEVVPKVGIVVDSSEKTPVRVLHIDDKAGLLKVAKEC